MKRSFRRVPASNKGRSVSRTEDFPAPSLGWILNENLAQTTQGGALVLENGFPTATGARVRGGTYKYQKVSGTAVLSMWTYKSGSHEAFFAADETKIFDVTNVADADVIPSALIEGQTSGYYSTQQFGTPGGDYQVCVNGSDVMWVYNGTEFFPVNDGTINKLSYFSGTASFVRGETITTAGGSATVVAVDGDAVSGVLMIGPVTGTISNGEALTGSVSGSATASSDPAEFSTVAISDVSTSGLSQVWSFASRLFFVKKGTQTAVFLPVDSIGGAAQTFSLAGIFKKGGSLLFGATWSLDSGDGLDDKCVFVSTEGEVAVYEGTDPSNSATWSKVGVYQIGKPLGIKATMQAGGDLLVATDAGLVPLTQAINQDVASLSKTGASRQIYPKWATEAANRRDLPWEIMKWTEKSMMIISQPRNSNAFDAECLVANLETGAWGGPWTNLDTRCLATFQGRGFFGSNDGTIREFERGGSDDGLPYTFVYVDQFSHLKSPGRTKTALQARATFKAAGPFNYKLSASVNYNVSLPAAPNSADDYNEAVWDTALWDVANWDGASQFSVVSSWKSIGRTGFTIAPQIQITCGVTPTPKIELIVYTVTYVDGGVVN